VQRRGVVTSSIEPLDDDLRRLYAEPRSTFLDRRKELAGAARRDGDRERARLIAALRKPSVAAHAVNLLAQTDDPALGRVLELGAQVRQAFAAGEDGRMRELLQERNSAVADASKRAREVAKDDGESVSAAVNDQIVQTLRAAMAADDAADLVRHGTLTEALDEPGFAALGVGSGPAASRRSEPSPRAAADPDRDADAAPRRTSKQRAATSKRAVPEEATEDDLEEARRARAAREAEEAASAALDDAVSRLAISTDRRRELETQRDDAVAELRRIESELETACAAETDAEDEHRRASEALDAARRAGSTGPTTRKKAPRGR
jgi:hypothetical protein